jgi:hypothetical protein
MPSIIPGYVYALFASLIVGTLVIGACGVAMANIKANAETQQLSNISSYVATKSLEALSSGSTGNFTLTCSVDVPPLIGNQRYWLRLDNSSSYAWVEAGFGSYATESAPLTYIPCNALLSGDYVSGSGPAFIQFVSNSSGFYLTLFGGN